MTVISKHISRITDNLVAELKDLRFGPPVQYVYQPLDYARAAYEQYVARYGDGQRPVLLLGMNPGPWGMAQTGVPFGEIETVTNWLGIDAAIESPPAVHPKRPVLGYGCTRAEVSGKRLWGWARERFKTPQRFFERFFVVNYCPLLFVEASGRNRTPDKLPAGEKKPLLAACDRALREMTTVYRPRYVIGIGLFAAKRAEKVLTGLPVTIGRITHPSPANPKANRGWQQVIEAELIAMGIGV